MFTITPRLKEGVALINTIEDAKFSLLVSRILEKNHAKDERVFSEDEETKLQSSLSLKQEEVQLVLEILTHILREVTFQIAKPEQVMKQLELVRLDRTKSESVVDAWTARAKTIVANLRQTSVEPKQLDSVNWRLNLSMGQGTRTKLKQPIAQFELGVINNNKRVDHLFLEFNQQELFGLYSQLEEIQTQLDCLR